MRQVTRQSGLPESVVEWFSALKTGWVRLGVAEENRALTKSL
jgi:hypothetical protein